MLQGYSSCQNPVFRRFSQFQRFLPLQSFCRLSTPPLLVPFALILSRKYSLALFRAQIKAIKMLQGSIHPANTPVFRIFL